jgi:hypothetical protein
MRNHLVLDQGSVTYHQGTARMPRAAFGAKRSFGGFARIVCMWKIAEREARKRASAPSTKSPARQTVSAAVATIEA